MVSNAAERSRKVRIETFLSSADRSKSFVTLTKAFQCYGTFSKLADGARKVNLGKDDH